MVLSGNGKFGRSGAEPALGLDSGPPAPQFVALNRRRMTGTGSVDMRVPASVTCS